MAGRVMVSWRVFQAVGEGGWGRRGVRRVWRAWETVAAWWSWAVCRSGILVRLRRVSERQRRMVMLSRDGLVVGPSVHGITGESRMVFWLTTRRLELVHSLLDAFE